MKKGERSIKKTIKKRIIFKSKMNQRNKLRASTRPPRNLPVDLVSRTAIRNGTFKFEVVKNNQDSFQILVDKLVTNEPFSFLRFGDADYMMMGEKNIGKIIGASNKMIITPEFNKEIIESHSIIDPNYIIGTVLYPDLKNRLYDYNPFLSTMYKKFLNYDISYNNMISAVALTETFFTNIELFSRLIILLNTTNTMFVGSYYHENLDMMYGNIDFKIKTPKQNSYKDVDRIYNEILENINNVDKIIFSCGQTSRIIIKRLWKLGIKKTMIDVGSLSDYFVLNTELGTQIQLRGHIKKNSVEIKNNFKKLKELI